MTSRSAYLFFSVIGLLIIFYALSHALHFQLPFDSLLIKVLGGIGIYLLLVNFWAYYAVSDEATPQPPIGASTHATVFGFLLILATVTYRLLEQPLPIDLMTAVPALGIVLVVLGIIISAGRPDNLPTDARFDPADLQNLGMTSTISQRVKDPNADSYGMAPRSAYTFFVVLGFVMILYAITHILHFQEYNEKLIYVLVGIGLFLMLVARWMFRKTGIVRIIRPYPYLGVSTFISVVGFLAILVMSTLQLMNMDIEPNFYLSVQIGGIFLIVLGFLLNVSVRQVVRLDEAV